MMDEKVRSIYTNHDLVLLMAQITNILDRNPLIFHLSRYALQFTMFFRSQF
jgi:hypothetical protein